MKTNEVKLSVSIDVSESTQTKTPVMNTNSETASFVEFLNDQLASEKHKITVSKTSKSKQNDESEEVKEADTDKSAVTTAQQPATAGAQNESKQLPEDENPDKKRHIGFDDDFMLRFDGKKLNSDEIKSINQLIQTNGVAVNINQINGFRNALIEYNGTSYSSTSQAMAKNLSGMLNEAYKTNKPVRIDFENNSSVILKIDKDGKLSAQFITSDKAMEMLLKENIMLLRAKLDKEGLPYKELSYNDQSNKDENQQREDKNYN